jgi:hypothetical protein
LGRAGLHPAVDSADVRAMPAAGSTFTHLVDAILRRYFRQNAQPEPAAEELAMAAAGLWSLVEERGLPRALGAAERGEPGEMTDAEVSLLLERGLADVTPTARAALSPPVKQLVKACFYPEFKSCRDSFRAVAADGSCQRQELVRTRGRVSGAHCVDCPHWVALTPEQHFKYLVREWLPAGAGGLAAHRDVFLPEDFRALRRFLQAWARRSPT